MAVVCEREEHAIQAARQLKVNWQKPATAPFPSSENLHRYMRMATPTFSAPPTVSGNIDTALGGAAKVVEAEYEVPFQGHVSIGPAHAMADPSNDQLTIYSNDMKSYGLRNGVAQFLQMPRDRVRVIWMEGPQAYGRTAADDAGFEAAFLAKEIGRPVRVQWMRQEETAWDTKGRPTPSRCAAGWTARATSSRYDYEARGGRSQSPRLQRIRHRADRAAGGHAQERAGPRRRGHAVGHVRHSQPPHGDARRRPAARVGNTAAHRQPARPERAAGDVRVRVVHRRAGRRGEDGFRRVPVETAHGEHGRRQRVQARALDRGASRRRPRSMAGTRGRRRSRSAAGTSSPAAASPTRTATRRSWRRSRKSK